MQTIRWGIIGCGDVTEIKSGPAFQKIAGSSLVAVMRRDAARAADYARRHGVPKWYDDAAKLIADPEVNAIYVATPPVLHETYALAACAAGKPCYVEKPMARNAAEAERMVDAFAARGLPLFVAYYRRAQPRFNTVKRLLAGGQLGPVKNAQYTYLDSQMSRRAEPVPWRLQAEQAGGGLFLDLGSHALDLLDFFLGALTDVHGHATNVSRQYDVEDQVNLAFSAPGNVLGRADFQFNSDQRQDMFTIECEKGSVRFSCFGTEPPVVQTMDESHELTDFAIPQHVQQPFIQAMVDFLHGDDHAKDWISTGAVAQRTQRVMDLAIQDFYGGREDGFWARISK